MSVEFLANDSLDGRARQKNSRGGSGHLANAHTIGHAEAMRRLLYAGTGVVSYFPFDPEAVSKGRNKRGETRKDKTSPIHRLVDGDCVQGNSPLGINIE